MIASLSNHTAREIEADQAILYGLKEELLDVGNLNGFKAGGPTVEEKAPEEEWKEEYYDEISGALLKPEEVKKAREEEVSIAHKLKVYRQATEEEMKADGCKIIPI